MKKTCTNCGLTFKKHMGMHHSEEMFDYCPYMQHFVRDLANKIGCSEWRTKNPNLITCKGFPFCFEEIRRSHEHILGHYVKRDQEVFFVAFFEQSVEKGLTLFQSKNFSSLKGASGFFNLQSISQKKIEKALEDYIPHMSFSEFDDYQG